MYTKSQWKTPKLVAKSDKPARPDQDNIIDASEFLDDPETLALKVKAVAELVRKSKHCVVYTGAGISKTSGIPDYATRAVGSVVGSIKRLSNPYEAQPTIAHDALASIYRAGLIKEFINQNHDGLFEKAGVKAIHSNLIHGDWFDVANPVVQFSQSLRSDLFKRLLKSERAADLVLVAGTSLSGMNADRVAFTCAQKAAQGARGVLGSVLVNLQRTSLDDAAAVRIWAKTDDFFPMLAEELEVSVEQVRATSFENNTFLIPYDEKGKRLAKDDKQRLVLDLSPGCSVTVCNPDASNLGRIMKVSADRDDEGNWLLEIQRPGKFAIQNRLGRWYISAALAGELDQLPFVNVDAKLVTAKG